MNLSALDFKKVSDFARKGLDKARQYAEGLNELEIKVEEATNSDRWGPHGTLMQEITKRSYNMEEYKQILGILARRLHSEPNSWRQIYKSLLLLEYMAKNGPHRVIPELKSNGRVFSRLQKFEFTDEDGKDQGLNVRNRAKELWNLVHDDELIASEREKAAANRKKYVGHDQSSSMFQSMPSRSSASSSPAPFTTELRRNGGAEDAASSADADAVAATEQRLAQLGLTDNEGSGAAGVGVPPPKQARHKPKLSQISADNSIAGSIAAIAAKAPAPPPKVAPPPEDDGGMNLLDFGDDEPAAPSSSDPMALLDQLSNATAPPKAGAAAAANDDEDWADFASTEPAVGGPTATAGTGAAGQGDWAPFTGAAQSNTGDKADDWADFTSAPGAVAPSGSPADPFGMPAVQPSVAPAGFGASVPAAGLRQALPLDAFTAPAVEPIPAQSGPAVSALPSADAPAPVSAPVKLAPPEKDPFADLLG